MVSLEIVCHLNIANRLWFFGLKEGHKCIGSASALNHGLTAKMASRCWFTTSSEMKEEVKKTAKRPALTPRGKGFNPESFEMGMDWKREVKLTFLLHHKEHAVVLKLLPYSPISCHNLAILSTSYQHSIHILLTSYCHPIDML